MQGNDYENHFATSAEQSLLNTVTGVVQAAYTVIFVPEHDSSICEEAVKKLRSMAQPIQAPLDEELAAIATVTQHLGAVRSRRLKQKELIGLTGVLMQFMFFLPKLRPYCQTSFAVTEDLYQSIVKLGEKTPLAFADQLSIALSQTDGDLPEALWRLFITARLYARWLDTNVIAGLPAFTREEIVDRMCTWSRTVAACKPYGSCPDQDASGDTYYCWTHALAKVVYRRLAKHQTPLTKLEIFALQNGTRLNHGIANRVSPQRVPSNHSIAAAYGNAIGTSLIDAFADVQTERFS